MNLIIQLEHLAELKGRTIHRVVAHYDDKTQTESLIFTCEDGIEVIIGAEPTEEKGWWQEK